MKRKNNLAVAGVGNCASSPLQGLEYYQHRNPKDVAGLMRPDIGGYSVGDVRAVSAARSTRFPRSA